MRVESKNWEDILAAQILNLDPQGEYRASTRLDLRLQREGGTIRWVGPLLFKAV